MKKNILFLVVFSIVFFMAQSVLGQDNDKSKIIDYLIKIGDLKPIDKKEIYFDNVFIMDILTFEDASKKTTGIFKFGTFADHSKVYILLRDKELFQILSLNKLDEDLLLELAFLKKLKLQPSESLKYIEATIAEYQKNMKVIPWTD
ncbi:MAG TPA: hypothetical protein DCQ26_06735 [Marinilabiliales bacterium]|nr:MAG: hypothetical protein A2W95_11630 [Bacteroidetes bacterium GWA2_40_14]OFX59854.1 MAG: hypothetical protein A2W84_06635 [Bacteroidetes bacterium GWC2_40_13]OFX71590.1 MAG: hypothetical protein A2W96_10620 [Bacteroidetes bacterium GWD2_40_43]OFX95624.1 MAG: hypothetical protein A2W97_00940 [Bacteroidetes bacterium GWE2_40_63]OFY22218.1 MAG: hypothetical protein A2W88_06785 [Bacteroidetes bacterium GWF2_40_13]OFZ24857.1 MAG: hypothetical protein A2437_14420 [Bacteroidetes bacterium RIFOXYC